MRLREKEWGKRMAAMRDQRCVIRQTAARAVAGCAQRESPVLLRILVDRQRMTIKTTAFAIFSRSPSLVAPRHSARVDRIVRDVAENHAVRGPCGGGCGPGKTRARTRRVPG